jgi:hypothetical protein
MFLWASYVVGQDTNGVWWPTDLVSGYTKTKKLATTKKKKAQAKAKREKKERFVPPWVDRSLPHPHRPSSPGARIYFLLLRTMSLYNAVRAVCDITITMYNIKNQMGCALCL